MNIFSWINNLEKWLNEVLLIFLAFLKNLPICEAFREIGIRGTQEFLLQTSTGYICIAIIFFAIAVTLRWLMRLPRYSRDGHLKRFKAYGGHSVDQRFYQTTIILFFASAVCIGIRAYLKYIV